VYQKRVFILKKFKKEYQTLLNKFWN